MSDPATIPAGYEPGECQLPQEAVEAGVRAYYAWEDEHHVLDEYGSEYETRELVMWILGAALSQPL